MKLDHDDPEVQRMFSAELQAQRMGIPPLADAPFEYRVGIERAAIRNPDELHQLAARFTPGDDGKLTTDLTPAQLAEIDATPVPHANPNATQPSEYSLLDCAKVLAALHRDLDASGDADETPPADDPAAEPIERERARRLRNYLALVRARRDEPRS
jgi:hypothetical protein